MKNRTITITVHCSNEDCEEPMEFQVIPGTDPYPTSDHDHPLFSDPGSGPELDSGDLKCPKCGTMMEEEAVLEAAADYEPDEPDCDRDED